MSKVQTSPMSVQELYRQLRSLGFSAEQAIAEIHGDGMFEPSEMTDAEHYASATTSSGRPVINPPARGRQIAVTVPQTATRRRTVNRGPRMEYAAKPVPKGRKVVISMGNNTDVYKFLSSLRGRKATVPAIAKATGISPHSVESSVYRLVTDGLVVKSAIEGR